MKHNLLFFSILAMFSICISCDQLLQENSSVSRRSMTSITSIHNLNNINTYIETSNEKLVATMEMTIQTKVQYQPLIPIAVQVQSLTTEFHRHIDKLKDLMTQESNGVYTESDTETESNRNLIGMPKGGNNKKVVKQIFISGQYDGAQNEPQGDVLDMKLQELKDAYIQIIADLWDEGGVRGTIFADQTKKAPFLSKLAHNISISDYKNIYQETTWVEENFKGKTVQETYLLLIQYQNQVNLSTA
ncbi:MAG: hypothetical protein JKY03_07265, partial [Aureispira sp.]|nr:hypothetical protein [Aureispira sp.]